MAKSSKMAADKKELEDLVSALGENRLSLRTPCMKGTRTAILQKIEDEIKNVNGLDKGIPWRWKIGPGS